METAAIIIVIGSALLAAAIGFGLAWAYDRYRSLRFPLYWFAGGGAVIGVLLSLMVISGWPMSLLRVEVRVPVDEVTPYMLALKPGSTPRPSEDALYERLVTLVLRDREDGRSEAQVRFNAVSQVMSYAADKISLMPDDIVHTYYVFTRDELGHLGRQKDFEACADVALGRIRGDIEDRLSPDLVERQRSVITRIIATPADPGVGRLAQELFQVMVSKAFANATQVAKIEPNEIEVLLSGAGEPEKVCRLMKVFFDAMLTQPVETVAPALRALAAGERGAQ
jgi:hypothetical protein